jgi:hypothetical protein
MEECGLAQRLHLSEYAERLAEPCKPPSAIAIMMATRRCGRLSLGLLLLPGWESGAQPAPRLDCRLERWSELVYGFMAPCTLV